MIIIEKMGKCWVMYHNNEKTEVNSLIGYYPTKQKAIEKFNKLKEESK